MGKLSKANALTVYPWMKGALCGVRSARERVVIAIQRTYTLTLIIQLPNKSLRMVAPILSPPILSLSKLTILNKVTYFMDISNSIQCITILA